MNETIVRRNERSWAIEVISKINEIVSSNQAKRVTVENRNFNPPHSLFNAEFEIPARCEYSIELPAHQIFGLIWLKGEEILNDQNLVAEYELTPKYGIIINGELKEEEFDDSGCLYFDSPIKYNYFNGNDDPILVKVSIVLMGVAGMDSIPTDNISGLIIRMKGSPLCQRIQSQKLEYLEFTTTAPLDAPDAAITMDQIRINCILKRDVGVGMNADWSGYNNGYVYSHRNLKNRNNQALTYCNKDQLFINKGMYCLKFTNEGITKSSDGGETWTSLNIF